MLSRCKEVLVGGSCSMREKLLPSRLNPDSTYNNNLSLTRADVYCVTGQYLSQECEFILH